MSTLTLIGRARRELESSYIQRVVENINHHMTGVGEKAPFGYAHAPCRDTDIS